MRGLSIDGAWVMENRLSIAIIVGVCCQSGMRVSKYRLWGQGWSLRLFRAHLT